jgi:gamma-glutamyl:cysteine ligase YbdK (ATP-grasp superfamily)
MSEPLGLWGGVGVEIEYMIVDSATLDVKPVADRLLAEALGREWARPDEPDDVERGTLAWSNELALHVVELKTARPVAGFAGLAPLFQESVEEIRGILGRHGARLMPGGMHPWMDPERELKLWPHENNEIYRAFDRIFGCRGHGWANLQSTHVNLPFRGDQEFARLHDAVRLVLPLVPGLAAASPVVDGALGPALDNRLLAYRENAKRVPSVTGGVVPERVASRAEYRERVLERIYEDMRPWDPEGVLRHEWVNARGAIARFDRGSIEVRVIDAQECVLSDLAVAAAVAAAVRHVAGIASERGTGEPSDASLRDVLERTVHLGSEAVIADPVYLARLGLEGVRPEERPEAPGKLRAREAWRQLAATVLADPDLGDLHAPLKMVLARGTLAERLARTLGSEPDRERLAGVYGRLCRCVEEGIPLEA